MDFYGRDGSPIAYLADGTHLYLWNGKPVAYLADGKVYAFSGAILGWFQDGWIYDLQNRPALFSHGATSGPTKPMTRMASMKSMRQMLPMKSMRSMAPMRPMRSASWSPLANLSYFAQG